ncbi:hypothetical protein ACFSVK_12145 [Azorhizophilus paspali]|uniref:Transposase n=1 Tax=Azorhizophilus paspali TaxID=69963 RepID=A0ABV6SSY8_AZOPA
MWGDRFGMSPTGNGRQEMRRTRRNAKEALDPYRKKTIGTLPSVPDSAMSRADFATTKPATSSRGLPEPSLRRDRSWRDIR